MNLTTEVAWTRLQTTLQGLVAALPNVLLATLIFLVW